MTIKDALSRWDIEDAKYAILDPVDDPEDFCIKDNPFILIREYVAPILNKRAPEIISHPDQTGSDVLLYMTYLGMVQAFITLEQVAIFNFQSSHNWPLDEVPFDFRSFLNESDNPINPFLGEIDETVYGPYRKIFNRINNISHTEFITRVDKQLKTEKLGLKEIISQHGMKLPWLAKMVSQADSWYRDSTMNEIVKAHRLQITRAFLATVAVFISLDDETDDKNKDPLLNSQEDDL